MKGTDFLLSWCHRQASFRHIYAGTDSTFFKPQRDYFNKICASSGLFSQQLAKRGGENQFLICSKISFVWFQSLGFTHQKARKLLRAAMQRGNGTRFGPLWLIQIWHLKKKKNNYFPGSIWCFQVTGEQERKRSGRKMLLHIVWIIDSNCFQARN